MVPSHFLAAMLADAPAAALYFEPLIACPDASPLRFGNRAACQLLATDTIDQDGWQLDGVIAKMTSVSLACRIEDALGSGKAVEGLTGWSNRPNELYHLTGRSFEGQAGFGLWLRRIDPANAWPSPWFEGWRDLEASQHDYNYVAEIDVGGGLKVVWCDDALARHVGSHPSDAAWDGAWRNALGAETRKALQQRNRRLLEGTPGQVLYRLGRHAGQSVTVIDHAVPIRAAADDEILGAVARLRTVEERAAVAESAVPFQTASSGPAVATASPPLETCPANLLDDASETFMIVSPDGNVVSCFGAAERILEHQRTEIVGRPLQDFVATIQGTRFDWQSLPRLAQDPSEVWWEALGKRAGFETFPVEIQAKELSTGHGGLLAVTIRDLSERRQTESTIRKLIYHDALTGLPNRLLFNDKLDSSIETANRTRQTFAVLLIGLDRFERINVSLGLDSGDTALKAVAARFNDLLGHRSTVARMASDQFVAIVPTQIANKDAEAYAQRVLSSLRRPTSIKDHELPILASIGIALFPQDGSDGEALVKNAGTALSWAKRLGRDRFCLYTTEMDQSAFDSLRLENDLARALERQELIIHYQPVINAKSGRIVGVEALIRWMHSERGLISPARFIPLAEDTGLIVPIGSWVLREACRQVRRWQVEGFSDLRLAVNLSARQFYSDELYTEISNVLNETGLAANKLELELTESVIMRDGDDTIRRLCEITELGVSFAIDDFGTGYSSLSYLKKFPIRSLKIDRSFVKDIDSDANSAAIAQTIVAMAANLGLNVVAEGVETETHKERLAAFGCEEMQGFLFGRPEPPDKLRQMLGEVPVG